MSHFQFSSDLSVNLRLLKALPLFGTNDWETRHTNLFLKGLRFIYCSSGISPSPPTIQVNGLSIPAEAYLQNKAQHRHVTKIYEIFTTEEHYVYVMERPEFCKDLFDILQMKVFLTEKEARRYFAQILEASISCEENGVIHRDLKPENILVDMSNNEIKLIDFGLASEVQDQPFNTFRGEK